MTTPSPKKRRKLPRGPFNKMAVALAEYIKSLGGSAIVVGGVSVGQHPGALKYNYFVQISITGIMPKKKV